MKTMTKKSFDTVKYFRQIKEKLAEKLSGPYHFDDLCGIQAGPVVIFSMG